MNKNIPRTWKTPGFDWLKNLGMDLNSIICPRRGSEIEMLEYCFLIVNGWGSIFKWWKMSHFNLGSKDGIIIHKGHGNFNYISFGKRYVDGCYTFLKRKFENRMTNLSTIYDELQIRCVFFLVIEWAKGVATSWLDWCSSPYNAPRVRVRGVITPFVL